MATQYYQQIQVNWTEDSSSMELKIPDNANSANMWLAMIVLPSYFASLLMNSHFANIEKNGQLGCNRLSWS